LTDDAELGANIFFSDDSEQHAASLTDDAKKGAIASKH